MSDKPVEHKITDLLKDYDVDAAARARGRYIEVPTTPQEYRSKDGMSFGVHAPPSLMGCKDCGAVVFDPPTHDRDHARKRQSRVGL